MEEEDTREVLLPNWQGSGSMGITLDQNEEGGVYVKQLAQNSPAAKTGVMKEGDQIVGATVYFDNMSQEDIQRLLANVGQHTVGLRLQRKGDRSPQPGMSWSHDVFSLKSPDVVLSGDDEEYRRIYTKKIKPRLKSDDSLEPETQTRTITVTKKVTAYTVDVTGSTESEEIDISSPEYKIKIPRREVTEISKTTVDTGEGKTVIKIPGAGLGEEQHFVTTRSKVSIPGDSTSVYTTNVRHYEHSGGISEFPDIQTDQSVRMTNRSSGVTEFPDINISGPKFKSYEQKVNVKSSRFEIDPEVDLRSPNISGVASLDINTKGLAARASDVDYKTTSTLDFPDQQRSTEYSRSGLQSSVSIKGPQLDIKKPSGFKMDSYSTDVQLQEPDINLSAQQTRIGFALPKMSEYGPKEGTMYSQVDLTVPTKDDDKVLQIDSSSYSGKIQIPTFTTPKFGLSETKNENVKSGINLQTSGIARESVTTRDIQLESSQLKGKVYTPSVNVRGPAYEVSSHTLDTSAVNFGIAKGNFETHTPKIESKEPAGDLKGPSVKMPSMKVELPNVSAIETDLKSRDGKVTIPQFKMPKFGLSGLDAEGSINNNFSKDVTVSGPIANINMPSMQDAQFTMQSVHLPKVPLPEVDINVKGSKLEGEIKGPKVDFKGSGVKLATPDLDIDGRIRKTAVNLDTPSVNMSGKVKDQPITITPIDVAVKDPTLKGGLNVEMEGPGLVMDIDQQCGEGEFQMPKFGDSGKKIELAGELKGHKLDIKGPNLAAPNVKIESKGFVKMPEFGKSKFGVSGPKAMGPDVDVNLQKGKLDISGPKVNVDVPDYDFQGPDGKITGSNFKMPSTNVSLPVFSKPEIDLNLKGPIVDIKGPVLDLVSPDADIDGKGKINIPKFSMPKFNISGPKVEGPDVDITLPRGEFDVPCPKVDVDVPNLEGPEGKIKGPKFKLPLEDANFKKVPMPDFDLNLKGPKLEGDLKAPEVDVNADVDIDGKLKGSKFNTPSIQLPKMSMPEFDMNLKAPKVEGDLKGPKVDIKGPKMDVVAPVVDLDGKGEIKMPKFKMPKFGISVPKVEGPDVDITLPRGELDVACPKVDMDVPDFDLEGPEGKIKGAKINMPSLNVTFPKVHMPDFDLNLKAPKLQGDLKGPTIDIKSPKFGLVEDLKCPKVDIKTPEMNIDATDVDFHGKVKDPVFKMPSIPDIDLDLKGPKLEGDLKGHKVDIKGPQIDVNNADLDIDGKAKGTSFTMPSIHLPKMSMPDFNLKLKGPNWKGDVSGPQMEGDIKVPGADVEEPEGKMPKFKLPKFGFSGPNVAGGINLAGPKVDLEVPDTDIEGPKGKIKGSQFNVPSLDVNLPKISVPDNNLNLKGPNWSGEAGVTRPNVNIELPDIDAEGPKGKFKMPKFGVTGTRVDADMDVTLPKPEMNVSGPKIDLESPEVEGKLKGQKFKMNMDLPKLNVPHLDIDIKGPKLKGNAELSGPKVGAVDLAGNVNVKKPNIDVKTPDVNIEAPDVTLKSPGMDIEGPEVNLKMPKVKKSKFGFGIKGPKAEVKSPSLDTAIPDVEFDADVPEVDAEIKGKRGKFKMPKIHMSGPKIKGKKGGFDVSTPDMESDINLNAADADINLSGGEADLGIKAPKTRKPLFGKIYFPDVEFDLKSPKLKGDAAIHSPKVDIKTPGFEIEGDLKTSAGDLSPRGVDIGGSDIKVKKSKFKLPTFNVSGPKVPEADLHLSSPKLTGDLNAPRVDVNLGAPDINLKAPSASVDPSMSGISIPDVKIDMKGPKVRGGMDVSGNLDPDITGVSGKGKVPKFGIPTFGVPGSQVGGSYKVGTPDLDGNLKGPHIEMSTVDMSLPKVSDSDFEMNLSGPKIRNDMDISNDLSGGKFNVGLPGVNMKGFDANVALPKVDVSGPSLHGLDDSLHGNVSVSGPKLELLDASSKAEIPYVNVKGMEGEIKVPKVDLKGKGFKFGVEKPEKDFQGASMEGDLSGNVIGGLQFKGTEGFQISGPNVEAGQSRAGVNFSTTGGYYGEPVGIVTFPRLMMPKFTSSGPELTGREVGVDVDFPKTNVSLGKSDQADIELEESNIKIKKSKIKMPKFNFSKAKGKSDASLSDVSVTESKGELKSSKASLGSVEGAGGSAGLEVGSGVGISSKEKSAKYEFSLFTSSKSRHRSSSLSEEMDSSTQSSPSGTLEAKGGEVSLEGGKKKGKHSKIKFGTFGGIGSKSKGSYEVTLSDDENVQGSGASLSSRKSRVSSSSSNDSATKAGVQLPKVELTVAKKKE